MAWSKIEADSNNLGHEQMKKIVDDISYGLGLDHPHVIKVRARAPRPGPSQACRVPRGALARACCCLHAGARTRRAAAGWCSPVRAALGWPFWMHGAPTAAWRVPPPLPLQCFQCWEDSDHSCINMITEFFTSGALRCALQPAPGWRLPGRPRGLGLGRLCLPPRPAGDSLASCRQRPCCWRPRQLPGQPAKRVCRPLMPVLASGGCRVVQGVPPAAQEPGHQGGEEVGAPDTAGPGLPAQQGPARGARRPAVSRLFVFFWGVPQRGPCPGCCRRRRGRAYPLAPSHACRGPRCPPCPPAPLLAQRAQPALLPCPSLFFPLPRLDKIYINGHSGEIKIGDLGLAVLAPRRFAPGAPRRLAPHACQPPPCPPSAARLAAPCLPPACRCRPPACRPAGPT